MIHKAQNYYTPQEYGRMCGVSERNIRDRIRMGNVPYVKIDRFYFINAAIAPPQFRINPHRPARPKFKAALNSTMFSFDGLRELGYFARGKHFSEGIIYEAIITDKLDGYVIGDKVFIKPAEAESFYKNRKPTFRTPFHQRITPSVKITWQNSVLAKSLVK